MDIIIATKTWVIPYSVLHNGIHNMKLDKARDFRILQSILKILEKVKVDLCAWSHGLALLNTDNERRARTSTFYFFFGKKVVLRSRGKKKSNSISHPEFSSHQFNIRQFAYVEIRNKRSRAKKSYSTIRIMIASWNSNGGQSCRHSAVKERAEKRNGFPSFIGVRFTPKQRQRCSTISLQYCT